MDHQLPATRALPRLTLVLGGAASGKSEFAENLLLASGLRDISATHARHFAPLLQAHVQRGFDDWSAAARAIDLKAE